MSTSQPGFDLSVVLPFRNAADTVREQLEALADQELDGTWELVAVDNCSEDASREIIESFSDGIQGEQWSRLTAELRDLPEVARARADLGHPGSWVRARAGEKNCD